MAYSFINEIVTSSNTTAKIDEGRMIRNKSKLSSMTAKDVSEILYLHIIALEIMKQEYDTLSFAVDYSRKTKKWNNFDKFQFTGTDLYLLIWALSSKSGNELFKDKNDKLFIDRIFIDTNDFKKYFQRIISNNLDFNMDRRFTLKLGSDLQINSIYRSMRRLAIEWNELSNTQKELLMTRLLQAFKTRAMQSDLYKELKKIADKNKLELKNVYNAETGQQEGNPSKTNSKLKKLAVGAAGAIAGWNAGKILRRGS